MHTIPDKSIHAVVLILPSKYVMSKIWIDKKIMNDIIHALSNFLNNTSDLFEFLFNFKFTLQEKIIINTITKKIINDDGKP
jgi:hypothetical protein